MTTRLLIPIVPLALLLLAGCAADLSAPARPVRPLAAYFSSDDYPATVEEESGTTIFRLTVGPDGRVANCAITSSSGSSALDSATCRVLRSRARFVPALDRKGRPTTGSEVGRIQWRILEDDEPVAPGPTV
jgi:protein TonB